MVAGAWICLLAPLAGAILVTLGGTRLSRRGAAYLSTASTFVAFGGALASFIALLGNKGSDRHHVSTAWTWIQGGSYGSGFEVLVDPLSVMMMLIVSGVGALIVAYSIGYMDGDDEERRYFAYMSIFVFSMLLLVQGGNLILLLAGWGMVGLSSYLLIGFWHERPSAIAAAKKAFVMNAIGDATMSQIGYMFLGAGLGAYANGMFHLMTHAFFKALLFMAGGIVIHALAGEQDMRKMGGLRAFLPRTYWAFVIGALALVGVPPFAGFFSKDSILAAAMDHGWYGYVLWAVGLVGAFLTGLYTFRMLFMVFWGEPSPYAREHFHALRRDVPGVSMESTVAVLAVLSVIGGAPPAITRRAAASSVGLGLSSPSPPCVLASLGARDRGIHQCHRKDHL